MALAPVAAIAVFGVASQALAESLNANNVAGAFSAYGVRSEASTDDYGDPYLELMSDQNFIADFGQVLFFNCDAAGECEDILMMAAFRPGRDPVYLDLINQWNVERRFARAYIDSDNFIVMDMDLSAYGGISYDAMENMVGIFLGSVDEFETWIHN